MYIFNFDCDVKIVDELMGRGKAQPLDALILTNKGFQKMKDIKVGGKVYGEDGFLHSVIGVYPQGLKGVYRITFSDGTSTLCCKEHLWTYQKPQDKSNCVYRTNSLEEIMKMSLYKQTKRGDKNWQFFIPMTKPIPFENNSNVKLPIHPYVLGVLLGDGHFSVRDSIGLTNSETDIADKVNNLIGTSFLLSKRNKADTTRADSYIILDLDKTANDTNRFKDIIRDLNLLGKKSYEKFIPDIYKYSTIENRIEILRGLIDTDGSIKEGNYEFSTTSKALAEDVKFIVQSLGGTSTLNERITHYSYNEEIKDGRISYRLYIKINHGIKICSSIKHLSKLKRANTNPVRSIRKIEYEGETECQCILVDSESHLYLTNDFIVTHNTSGAINYINNSSDEKFLYITPYLKEVKRIKENCPEKKFKEPYSLKGRKLEGIKELINRGDNVISTHALFQKFDLEVIDLCRAKNYTLIMDEVTDVIEPYEISKDDFKILKENFIDIDEDTGLIRWRNADDSYSGKFEEEKRLCELNSLAYYGGAIMMWLFPIEVFNAFRSIYILTYMFDAQIQRYYYDYYKLPYKYIYISGSNVKTFNFAENISKECSTTDFEKLIHIVNDEKMNQIGDREYSLSKSWYDRNKDNDSIKQLKNCIYNFFYNKRKSKSSDNIWTTFKEYRTLLSGKGYGRGYVALNMRASNDYATRTSVVYPVNRYINPGISNFFKKHDVDVDNEKFALSEMLQFIWRSAIRKGEEIYIYIPSIRMRNLLKEWIKENSEKSEE